MADKYISNSIYDGYMPKEEDLSLWNASVEDFNGYDIPNAKVPYYIVVADGSDVATKTYTLTFKTSLGATIKTQKLTEGDTVTYPTTPTVTGYNFSAWSQTISTMPAQNLTIIAQYAKKSYTVTYKVGTESSAITVQYQDTINIPTPTAETGYHFVEWANMPADKKMPDNENLVLEAVFTENTHTLTFTYQKEDGTVTSTTVDTKYGVNVESILPGVVQTGETSKYTYVLTGWTPEIASTTTVPDANTTYTAQYTKTPKEYTLTYYIKSGSTYNQYSAVTAAYDSDITMIALPTEDGYDFSDWVPQYVKMSDSNLSATTTQTAKKYTLTFKINDEVYTSITADYKSEITMPSPTKVGYTLSDWSTTYTTMPLNGGEVTATWIPKDVTITVAGYSGITAKVGETVTLPTLQKEGYTLTYDDTTIVDNKYTIPATDDATITLTYTEEINQYTLNVNGTETSKDYGTKVSVNDEIKKANEEYLDDTKYTVTVGGDATTSADTLTMGTAGLVISFTATPVEYTAKYVDYDDTVLTSVTTGYGENIVITTPTPTREGYTFSGWSETMPATMPNHDVTVKAQYTINSYKVKVNGNTGTTYKYNSVIPVSDIIASANTEYADTTKYENVVVKNGETVISESAITVGASDIDLTVTATPKVYTITYVLDGVSGTPVNVNYGETFTKQTITPAAGYEISKDWTETDSYTGTTMPNHNLVYVATTSKVKVTVTFKIGEASSSVTTTTYTTQAVWDEQLDVIATLQASGVTNLPEESDVVTSTIDGKEYKADWEPDLVDNKYFTPTLTGSNEVGLTYNEVKEATTIYYNVLRNSEYTGSLVTDNVINKKMLSAGTIESDELTGEIKQLNTMSFVPTQAEADAYENTNMEDEEWYDAGNYTVVVFAVPKDFRFTTVKQGELGSNWVGNSNYETIKTGYIIDGADYDLIAYTKNPDYIITESTQTLKYFVNITE